MKIYLLIFFLIFILYIFNSTYKTNHVEGFTQAVVNWDEIGGNVNQVSIGNDGTTISRSYVNDIYVLNDSTREWVNINKKFKYISVKDAETMAGINNVGVVFHTTNSGRTWTKLSTDGSDGRIFNTISIGYDNVLVATAFAAA